MDEMPAPNDRETRIVEYVDANLHTIVYALEVYAKHMESNATTAENEYPFGGYRRIVDVMRESRDKATKVARTLAQLVEAE